MDEATEETLIDLTKYQIHVPDKVSKVLFQKNDQPVVKTIVEKITDENMELPVDVNVLSSIMRLLDKSQGSIEFSVEDIDAILYKVSLISPLLNAITASNDPVNLISLSRIIYENRGIPLDAAHNLFTDVTDPVSLNKSINSLLSIKSKEQLLGLLNDKYSLFNKPLVKTVGGITEGGLIFPSVITPLSIVLFYNEKFIIRLDYTPGSYENLFRLVIKPSTKTILKKAEDVQFSNKLDPTTLAGAKLLHNDTVNRSTLETKDIYDLYCAANDINVDGNSVLFLSCLNTFRDSKIYAYKIDNFIPDTFLSTHYKDNKSLNAEVIHENTKQVVKIINEYLGPFISKIRTHASKVFIEYLHILSFNYLNVDFRIGETGFKDSYRETINAAVDVLENQVEPTYFFGNINTRPITILIKIRNRIIKRVLKKSQHISQFKNDLLTSTPLYLDDQKDINEYTSTVLENACSTLFNSYALSLYKITKIVEVTKNNMTVRNALVKPVVKSLSPIGKPSFVLIAEEGSNQYNMFDEGRYVFLSIADRMNYGNNYKDVNGIFLIDNLDAIIATFETFDIVKYGFRDLNRIALVRGPNLSFDNILNGLPADASTIGGSLSTIAYKITSKYSNSVYDNRIIGLNVNPTAAIDIVCFTNQDAANLNYQFMNSNYSSRTMVRPIHYSSITKNKEEMANMVITAFNKGIERLSETGKSFSISPENLPGQEITFHKDRIEFQGQVLKSSTLFTTVPSGLCFKDNDTRNYKSFNTLKQQPLIDDTDSKVRSQCFRYNEKNERIIDEVLLKKTVATTNKAIKEANKFYEDALENINKSIEGAPRKLLAPDVYTPLGFLFFKDKNKRYYTNDIVYSNISYLLLGNIDHHSSKSSTIVSAYMYGQGLSDLSADFLRSYPISSPDHLYFNVIADRFIDAACGIFAMSSSKYDMFREHYIDKLPLNVDLAIAEMTIGNVNAIVRVKISPNKESRIAKWSINGYKIRKDEINPILKRAMCFNAQDAFDKFLDNVSEVSLRARNLISKGLQIGVEHSNMVIPILLEFERENKEWILVIRNQNNTIYKKHKLDSGSHKFANMLAKIEKANTFGSTISKTLNIQDFLSLVNDIPGLGINSTKKLFTTGLKLVNEALARSRKLLEDTANMVKAEYVEITYGNKTRKGYKVTGSSGKSYLVCCDRLSSEVKDPHGSEKLGAVFALPNLQNVCIVDKSNDQAGYDIVVNRLLALKNDKYISGSITTLSRYTQEGE